MKVQLIDEGKRGIPIARNIIGHGWYDFFFSAHSRSSLHANGWAFDLDSATRRSMLGQYKNDNVIPPFTTREGVEIPRTPAFKRRRVEL